MSRDNAGQRVLNARQALRGAEGCLENTFGRQIPDGAQCFVIEEQANYRLVHNCSLPEDDRYVVIPYGDRYGRWVRAEGLVGFALLEGGKPEPSKDGSQLIFRGYSYQKLVQFEMTDEALVYIGSVPRVAHVSAAAGGLHVHIEILMNGPPQVVGYGECPSGAAMIHPGARIALCSLATDHDELSGRVAALRVVLA